MMYPLMLHHGGLDGAHSGLAPARDVARMNRLVLPFSQGTDADAPLAGRCADVPVDTFAATDCNSRYFQQVAATECPARLDYLMIRDVARHVRVAASELVYTESLDFGAAGSFELSDHFGMSATLHRSAPRNSRRHPRARRSAWP
ncbi:hypothetical protein SAMN02745121_06809 [Nannocystis exedens]|uniref:Endonuclease/Exonuclease/phosphatase family protein n=2 Tax=Nannocystis exedens TaxID=54 RepID=A0A1I2FS05_9BACT|nr:hypothetical protein NAEX_06778 [Nannocystis exedens]SFF08192.1 hypothetical protein SAMN02745121_06809 [Nannocystis exedens]